MSSLGTFRSGTGVHLGAPQVTAEEYAVADSIMRRFHSPLVIDKDTPQSLTYRYTLALARAISTMKQEAIATRNDNFLALSRVEHLDEVWGSMLNHSYNPNFSFGVNLFLYQSLLKAIIAGTIFEGDSYVGTQPVNLIAIVYYFTLITNTVIYENWRDPFVECGGLLELFECGATDPDSQSFIGGASLTGPAGGFSNGARTGLIRAGAQFVIPLTTFNGPSTDVVKEAVEYMRPAMADFAIVYSLSDTFPGGVDPQITQFAIGRGALPMGSLPGSLAFEVFRGAVFQTYTDSLGNPVPFKTTYRRYFGIMDREMVHGQVPLTEAALMDSGGNIKAYRTFSQINKDATMDVLMSWFLNFS